MRRRRFILAGSGAMLAACGGAPTSESKRSEAPRTYTKIDPATAAAVTGKVLFTGKKPTSRPIDMSGEESECKRMHSGATLAEDFVLNPDGTLANVFVYVGAGLENATFEPVTTPAQMDQKGCMFKPHVMGVRVGQPFVVGNSDPVTHNVHPMPEKNREWNQGQPPGAPKIERVFTEPEIMIPVKCNVHSWMKAYVGVVAHPFFTVTGESGTFELKGLPPGEYTIRAWHERFPAVEQKVTLAASASQEIEMTFKPA